jgi:dTDP-4-dehydrorhamnose reductase
MKLLVTGAAGQLGSALASTLAADWDVTALDRQQLDVTDGRAVRARVVGERPDVVANCTAYNHVDAAETDPVSAIRVNALGVRSVARAAADVGAIFIHYSTDFVFDGEASRPYTEDDPPSPRSVYATSKLLGEWFARDVPRHYVLRVESLFGGTEGRRASMQKIADALRDGREAPVFVDRTVSPSYVPDVIHASRALVERQAPPGLYHCVNSGAATWFDIGERLAQVLRVPPRLRAIRVADVVLPAPRPRYCALSNRRLSELGIEMPSWQNALDRYAASLVATTDPGRP